MLAEKKYKVVYSNPRGTLWANDKQKFGQRMLESMGWREGRGLGKGLNGKSDNIKASMKFDNKGLGFKPAAANAWMEDNNAYEQILTDLARHHSDTVVAVHSANEEKKNSAKRKKTKNHGGRLQHFRKTIRAKNLENGQLLEVFQTRRFAEDIEVGKIEVNNVEKEIKNSLELESKPLTIKEVTTFKTTSNGLSINDYFHQKMKSKLSSSSDLVPQVEANIEPFKSKKSKSSKKRKHEENLED